MCTLKNSLLLLLLYYCVQIRRVRVCIICGTAAVSRCIYDMYTFPATHTAHTCRLLTFDLVMYRDPFSLLQYNDDYMI